MKNTLLLIFTILTLTVTAQQQAILLGQWSDTTIVGSSTYDNAYNEIWGLVVNNKEYAVIGSTKGTHFIDVETFTEVAFVAGAVQGPVIIHRDYDDYNGYLYTVADEGNASTLQIIDYTTLPDSVSVVYDSNAAISRSHNIFIDKSSARLYALAVKMSQSKAMAIFDISTPTNPVLVGDYNTFGGNTVGHVHDAYVQNDTAYLNCGGQGLHVVDFTDLANPVTLGSMMTYPGQGYNHSGWLDSRGGYYYMADEDHNKPIKVVQVSDFLDLQVVQTMDAGATHNFSIPHNQIYHNELLFSSYYYDGLQVFDVSDPLQPTRAYYFDTYLGAARNNYEGAWGVYPFFDSGKILVSDMQTGLYVFSLPAVSTNEIENITDLKIFPQPFTNSLNIQLNNTFKRDDVQISLMDITGKTVVNFGEQQILSGENQFELNINEDLPKGVYILNIVGQHINLSQKVVK